MELVYGISLFHNQFKLVLLQLCQKHNETYFVPVKCQIGVEIFSEFLDENGILIDFGIIKQIMKKIILKYNSKIIVPKCFIGKNTEEDANRSEVFVYKNSVFLFPKKMCIFFENSDVPALEICKKVANKIKFKLLSIQNCDKMKMKMYIIEETTESKTKHVVNINFSL